MSLFGSIKMGGNTLQAMQIGLHVVGNNIANANTPGFIREKVIYVPAPVMRKGNLILGLGVKVGGIVQKIDRFVQDRLIGARSDRAGAEAQEKAYQDIEAVLNALSAEGANLSGNLIDFFNAIDEIAKEPANLGARKLAIDQGSALAENFGVLHDKVFEIQDQLNHRVIAMSDDINRLAEEIRLLNIKIATTEGGRATGSDAGALRVQRQSAVEQLSELIGVRVAEQPSGGLAVSVGGELIVFEGQRREVNVELNDDGGVATAVIEFTDTSAPLDITSGELSGLYTARNAVAGGFLEQLDELAATLAFEFNKLYSQGQGLTGFTQLTSTETVSDPNAALDAAGLAFTPVSGAFNVLIQSKDGVTTTHTISIDLDGLDTDTTLNSLAAQLDAIGGLAASVSSDGALELASESDDVEFAFAPPVGSSTADTNGVLAALGLNTFFVGSSASTLRVNDELKGIENAAKFAASLKGIDAGADNANLLAGLLMRPLESAGDVSLADLYNQMVNDIAQGAAIAQSAAEGFRVFEGTLDGQFQAVSGVNIDEEAIEMITLQRIYQASARYIQTLSELLDVLVNL
ncbi:MAG TPA: flagellar hook-associated protein FlgK [Lacipirellulaceae bacterium]|jgi:flagellar hook-associated protein 1 FlgK|nr:flagellar hook-associated protein FlgK [Lacipirellulaceae bacterium]